MCQATRLTHPPAARRRRRPYEQVEGGREVERSEGGGASHSQFDSARCDVLDGSVPNGGLI